MAAQARVYGTFIRAQDRDRVARYLRYRGWHLTVQDPQTWCVSLETPSYLEGREIARDALRHACSTLGVNLLALGEEYK